MAQEQRSSSANWSTPRSSTDLTFEERLAMERDYLDNISVAGDLAILLRTPAAIFRGEGSH